MVSPHCAKPLTEGSLEKKKWSTVLSGESNQYEYPETVAVSLVPFDVRYQNA